MTHSNETFSSILSKYVIGFGGALLLSVASYGLVVEGWIDAAPATIMLIILGLAALQLTVQLVCFLHLGASRRSFSRTGTFIFTILMMLVIVIGSLWIMRNLDYRMGMSSEAANDYMRKQNEKGF